jgi:hypothetical protein
VILKDPVNSQKVHLNKVPGVFVAAAKPASIVKSVENAGRGKTQRKRDVFWTEFKKGPHQNCSKNTKRRKRIRHDNSISEHPPASC